MMMMTYGILPSREVFDAHFEAACPHGEFEFGNDKCVGSCRLSCDEVWDNLQRVHADWDAGDEEAGDWCSSVLYCIGIEWV